MTPVAHRPVLPTLAEQGSAWPRVQAADRRIAFAPMHAGVLPQVVAVEQSAYSHPWTPGHFRDTLLAGHVAQMLLGEAHPGESAPVLPDGRLLMGYVVAMKGVDEVHLLNITVAPAHQRQGWACFMLDALALWSRAQGAHWLWLEVRRSNEPARALYRRQGFQEVGVRKRYYPSGGPEREDAMVMSLDLRTVQARP